MPKAKAGPHQLYVAELPTYGVDHPTKIGIAKNAERRCRQIGRIGSMPVSLKHVFEAESEARARQIETAVKKRFARSYDYEGELQSEVLDTDYQAVVKFIRKHAPDLNEISRGAD